MTKIVNLSKIKSDQAQLMDVLNKLMEKTNTNINQLSKNTGLANTTVKRMCTDPECNPTLTSITKIAAFFGVTPNQLIGAEPLPEETAGYYPDFEKWNKIPILTLSETLEWPQNIENIRESKNTKYVMTDIDVNEGTFAVISEDETLEPKFSEGTILIFDPSKPPKNKDFALLLMENKELPRFRQILIDGSDIYERVINPEFSEGSPSLLPKNKFKIVGILIQAKSNYI